MRASPILVISSLAVIVAAACSSSSSSTAGTGGGGGSTSTSSSTTTGTGMAHMNTCVQTTDMGNSLGVGKYCTPGGGECTGQPAGLCTADVGEDEWFCVKVGCQMDSDCGEMAQCVMQGGSGCVPSKCLGPADGGTGDSGDGG
jgi:hypothetical protein